jgi:hypothetical protein
MATTDPVQVPDWIYPGAEVAEWTDGRGSGSTGSVALTVVKSVGKRYVVLANGNRYDLHHLSRYTGGSWGYSYQLARLDDPDVLRVQGAKRRESTAWNVEKDVKAWRLSGDVDTLRQVIAALSAHLPEEG